jgi:pimeloyl-ACP methyl ester carboxylesterase
MAVDTRLYDPQRADFPDLITPRWIPHIHGESLRQYACRYAKHLLDTNALGDPQSPLILGGVSMGGMMSLELSHHLPTSAIILIGSCTSAQAVGPWMLTLESVSRPISATLIGTGKIAASPFLGRGVPQEHRQTLITMLQDVPPDFLKWCGRAIATWEGTTGKAPIHHIHGDRDWVIPHARLATPPSLVIRGGAHVLNLSHPQEVNTFITRVAHSVMESAVLPDGTQKKSVM